MCVLCVWVPFLLVMVANRSRCRLTVVVVAQDVAHIGRRCGRLLAIAGWCCYRETCFSFTSLLCHLQSRSTSQVRTLLRTVSRPLDAIRRRPAVHTTSVWLRAHAPARRAAALRGRQGQTGPPGLASATPLAPPREGDHRREGWQWHAPNAAPRPLKIPCRHERQRDGARQRRATARIGMRCSPLC